jgi:hypothetical protein
MVEGTGGRVSEHGDRHECEEDDVSVMEGILPHWDFYDWPSGYVCSSRATRYCYFRLAWGGLLASVEGSRSE